MTAEAQVTPPVTGTNAQSVKVTVTESPGTDYYILSRDDTKPPSNPQDASTWQLVATVTARDTDKAIEKYAGDNGNKAGTFVAIPASRFKPVKVTPQTVTTLKLEEAK